MKKILIISTACLAIFSLSNCKKVLDKQDLGNFTADQVYNDSTTTKLSMDYLYTQNQPSWFGNSGGAIGAAGTYNLTEETQGSNAYVQGTLTMESVGDIATSNSSGNNYGKIRTINMFIRDVNAGTMALATKRRFTAQAYFWRAYRYFELVKLYGGVPLITTPLDAVGDEAKAAALKPRNSTTETFALIRSDLDSCIKYLPVRWPQQLDYGRITSGAATAFLGRVLLTYASPQFNPNNDMSRWQDAYNANKSAVTILSANSFGLYAKWDYTMWTTEGGKSDGSPQNPEAVLVTEYNTQTTDNGAAPNSYDNSARPKYLGTTGGSFAPTYDVSLAFPMLDGKPATGTGASTKYPYSLATFYKNRDPRFGETIAYNGQVWGLLNNPNYRLWTYFYYTNAGGTVNKSTESAASSSGFYLRKGVNPALTLSNVVNAGTDWVEIRYAEVLLNLAESAAELSKLGTADESYAGLIALRKRAGIEAGTDGLYGLTAGMGHDAMITAIMKERQIELAFEGKRYWDLRRRKLLESTLNGTRRSAITILLKNTATSTDYILTNRDASAAASLDALYASSFTVTTKVLDTYNIAYQPAGYFFGIPTAAIQNNVNLQQNNTWGGPFDPLK